MATRDLQGRAILYNALELIRVLQTSSVARELRPGVEPMPYWTDEDVKAKNLRQALGGDALYG